MMIYRQIDNDLRIYQIVLNKKVIIKNLKVIIYQLKHLQTQYLQKICCAIHVSVPEK